MPYPSMVLENLSLFKSQQQVSVDVWIQEQVRDYYMQELVMPLEERK